MRQSFITISLLAITLLTACAKPTPQPQSAFVHGRARVIDLQPELGLVLLDMDGQSIHAFWQTEQTAVQSGGSQSNASPGPGGVYGEPEVRENPFPAKVGQTIDFIGMRSGSEIMLGRVAVVGQ